MFEFILLLLRAISVACRGHHDVVLENLALRHQLRTLQRRVKRPHLRTVTACFGSYWRPPGASGGRHWFSSDPTRLSAGIAPGCVGGGLSAQDATAPVVPRSILTSPDSSPTWQAPIRCGAPADPR